MAVKISQREARRLSKRVNELETILERQRKTWSQDWFGGVEIARITYDDKWHAIPTSVRTARKLNHAVVVVGDDGGLLRFVALPQPSVL